MAGAPDFQLLLKISPNPYMVLDRELRYVWANDAYLRLTASRLDDLVGKRLLDVFPNDPDDPDNAPARMLRDSLLRTLSTGRPDHLALIPYRVPIETPEGVVLKDRFWSASHTPILDEHGQVSFILQHTVDVTELQTLRSRVQPEPAPHTHQVEAGVLSRAEAVQATNVSLGSELRHLRRLFAQAPGFICFLRGPEHVFELANDAYFHMVGRSDIIGKPVREALPEVADQGFIQLLDQVRNSGEPFLGRGVPVRLARTAGAPPEERKVDFIYQPIVEADGETVGIFVQGNDVTEQKRLEAERAQLLEREKWARAEAERANQLKDDFLATVSHELRTPLTAMLGWVQMLRTDRLNEKSRGRALETIERNARTQAQLIEDLLDVSRIMAGKLKLELAPLGLAQAVEGAMDAVRPAAEAKHVSLSASLDPTVQVNGDPTRIQQVIWNLLSNAVKFTPSDGRVEVRLQRRGADVQLSVSDTGQGISPEFLPHVFERFRQADGSRSRAQGGLGLGLSIVKHLVEAHGGIIWAHSEGEGRGACFTVSFPAAQITVPHAHGRARQEKLGELICPAALLGLRVMVVDDDADARELLRTLLEGCGVQVETAGSAREGLERFHKLRPEVLVTDLGMPDEDGYALIRWIRALPTVEGGHTPAVALTAFAGPEDRTRALLAGFNSHVPKPIDPQELIAVLAALAPTDSAGSAFNGEHADHPGE